MVERAEEIFVHAEPEALARGAADWLCAAAIAATGSFSVCLAGGSTPKRLYELLSGPGVRERFPWQRVHWFWGDERFVPRTDPQSNYAMAHAAMLSRAPVPPENIHPMPTEGGSPAESAAAYERALQAFYGATGFACAATVILLALALVAAVGGALTAGGATRMKAAVA